MYAKPTSDDYWKLYYKFGGSFLPPNNPHPLLGWIGYFDGKTLDHWDINPPSNRRKVLIYGDSYIMCAHDSIQCFDEILNADTVFNKENVLLNYGVGGYGVDQIYFLFANTVDKFEKPFVVFSVMPTDMDRCLLSVRTGQKPYFIEEEDSLKLCGVPIDSVPDNFFQQNRTEITSYLWRRIINSNINLFYDPIIISDKLKTKIMQLNKKLLLRAYNDIKKRNLEYVFLIFDELWSKDGNWRVDSLQAFFGKEKMAFINTSNLVAEDSTFSTYAYDHYTIKGDGHPNSHYNRLVCEEIKKYIFEYNTYSRTRQNISVKRKEDHSVNFMKEVYGRTLLDLRP